MINILYFSILVRTVRYVLCTQDEYGIVSIYPHKHTARLDDHTLYGRYTGRVLSIYPFSTVCIYDGHYTYAAIYDTK